MLARCYDCSPLKSCRFSWSGPARAICEMGHNLNDYDVPVRVISGLGACNQKGLLYPVNGHRPPGRSCLKRAIKRHCRGWNRIFAGTDQGL